MAVTAGGVLFRRGAWIVLLMNRGRRHPAGEFPAMQHAGILPALPGTAFRFRGSRRKVFRGNLNLRRADWSSVLRVETTRAPVRRFEF